MRAINSQIPRFLFQGKPPLFIKSQPTCQTYDPVIMSSVFRRLCVCSLAKRGGQRSYMAFRQMTEFCVWKSWEDRFRPTIRTHLGAFFDGSSKILVGSLFRSR